jgi:hypothetical protein
MTSRLKSVQNDAEWIRRDAIPATEEAKATRVKLTLVSLKPEQPHEPLSELAPVGPTADF